MTRHLRDGGRASLPGGGLLVWSVAEGRRGRRWRTVVTGTPADGGGFTRAILLEVDLAGRPSRLELATPAGLLTLHPEPDGRSIHGNVVGVEGVRPLAFAWGSEHELDVAGDPVAIGLALYRRRASVGVGETTEFPVLAIDAALRVSVAARAATRTTEGLWLVADPATGATWSLAVGPDGAVPSDARWPLE